MKVEEKNIAISEQDLTASDHALKERMKELDCLIRLSRLRNSSEAGIDEILQQSVNIIPEGWQYPKETCARIVDGNRTYLSNGFKETNFRLFSERESVNGVLRVEVYYLTEKPGEDIGPFLHEEQRLLDTIAEQIQFFIERKTREIELAKKNQEHILLLEKYTMQNNALNQLNEKLKQDVEKKARLELKARMNAEKFYVFFNASNDPVFIHDLEGNFFAVNDTAAKITGYTKKELYAMSITQLDAPDSQSHIDDVMQALNEKGEAIFETVHLTKTGKRLPVEVSAKLVDYEGEKAILSIARDLTDRKMYERKLVEAKERAENSERLKTSFLANLSHEIRTPLNGIVGFSDMLAERVQDDGKTKEYVQVIQESSGQLLKIIEDLLEISSISNKQIKLNPEEFTPSGLLSEVALYVDDYKRIEGKDVRVDVRCLVEEKVVLDKERLLQVIKHLGENAIKFTNEGRVVLGCERVDDYNLRFYVKDTGIGIKPEDQDCIFDTFRQVDHGFTRNYGGNGLGLSIVKGIIESMGGTLRLVSEPGKGSEFSFILKDSREKLVKSSTSDNRILIIEDESMNFKLLKEYLEEFDVNILHASSGFEAMTILTTMEHINLILLDIRLPDMDGDRLARDIIAMYPEMPIIAQTAFAGPENERICREAGCTDYLSKPIMRKNLLDKINQYMELKKQE